MFVVRERVVKKIYAFKWEYFHGRDKNYSKEDFVSINNSCFHFINYFLPHGRILLNCFCDLTEMKKNRSVPFSRKTRLKQRLSVGASLVIVLINFFFFICK